VNITREDKCKLIQLQKDVWESLGELFNSISSVDWDAATDCPGWSVKDCLSHIVGIEHRLLGRDVPEHVPSCVGHVRNDLGLRNEVDVDLRRDSKPQVILEEFFEIQSERLAIMLSQNDFSLVMNTPLGSQSIADLISIRIFDCWVHEQDIRRAVGRPENLSGAVAMHSFSRIDKVMPYIVGKKGGVSEGQSVEFNVTGCSSKCFTIEVKSGRADFTTKVSMPTASLYMGSEMYLALACGRIKPNVTLHAGLVVIKGQETLGRRIVSHMNFMV